MAPKAQEAQQLSNTAYKFIQNERLLLRAADFNPAKMVIQHLKKIISIFQPGLWLKAVMVNNSTSNCQISERNCWNIDPAIKKEEFNDNLPIDLSVPKSTKSENKTFGGCLFLE